MITKMILLITLLVFSSLKFEPRVISAQEEARVISAYINAFYLKKEYADNIFTGRPNRIIVMLDKTLQCECETPLRKIAARNGIAIVQDFVNQNRKQAAYRNEGVEKYFTFALREVEQNVRQKDHAQ